jgi:hypothetical protein
MIPYTIQYLHNGKPAYMVMQASSESEARKRLASVFIGCTIAPMNGDSKAWARETFK